MMAYDVIDIRLRILCDLQGQVASRKKYIMTEIAIWNKTWCKQACITPQLSLPPVYAHYASEIVFYCHPTFIRKHNSHVALLY